MKSRYIKDFERSLKQVFKDVKNKNTDNNLSIAAQEEKKHNDLIKQLRRRVSVKKFEQKNEKKKPITRSLLSFEMGLCELGEQKLSN